MYLALGGDRSLVRVQELCTAIAPESVPSLRTLKGWSTQFEWVKDAEAFDARRSAQNTEVLLQDTFDIDRRHGQVGRALQQLALLGLNKAAPEQGGVRVLGSDVRPGDIARLAEAGVRIERLAAGLATERTEVLVQVWNAITVQVVELFLTVNGIVDENARAVRFAEGIDRIVDDQLAPVVRQRQVQGSREG